MWDLTPHSGQLLWSQRREQWNTNAGLGVRMREGKLDLQLPLWGTSTQSTRCKLSSFLAASPSWLCRRREKAMVYIWGFCNIPWKISPQHWSWVQLTQTIRTEPELQLLFCHSPPRRTWPQHGRGAADHISAVSEAWLLLLLPHLEQFQSLSSTSSQAQWAALHSPGALASLLLCPGRAPQGVEGTSLLPWGTQPVWGQRDSSRKLPDHRAGKQKFLQDNLLGFNFKDLPLGLIKSPMCT